MKKSIFAAGNKLVPKRYKERVSKSYYRARSLVLRGTTNFFSEVAIETNTRCNRRCTYCPNAKFDRGTKNMFMSEPVFYKIIDELREIKFDGRVVLSFYNEPLLDPRLEKLVSYIRKRLPKVSIVIFTNGDYLTKEKFHDLVGCGATNFLVTQHGNNTGPKLKNFLNRLNANEKKYITYQILTDNSFLSNRGGEVKVKNLDMKNKKWCYLPSDIVQVDYEGNVVLCCNDYHSSIKLGNLKNEKLINIWNKDNYRKLRKNLSKGIFKLPVCRKCVGLPVENVHK